MSKIKKNNNNDLNVHGKLYRNYADAVDSYVKQPTVNNWEKKEKAFETYNALIANHKSA
tara:strand:- start:30555 stop:30731 length:177 start_codon:yes stop_codon:yes gene_type:complete